jgi:hypothetical protein
MNYELPRELSYKMHLIHTKKAGLQHGLELPFFACYLIHTCAYLGLHFLSW